MTTKRDRPFLEAMLEGAEAAIDLAIDNEAVRAVPVIGTAFKIARGFDDLRSKVLAAKLARFLTEPGMQTNATRTKMRRKLAESAEEASAVGEALFLVIGDPQGQAALQCLVIVTSARPALAVRSIQTLGINGFVLCTPSPLRGHGPRSHGFESRSLPSCSAQARSARSTCGGWHARSGQLLCPSPNSFGSQCRSPVNVLGLNTRRAA